MLVTNNFNLWRAAYLNYEKFGVPVCTVKSIGSKTYTTTPEHLAELDMNISENRIGEIVNLSQFLNSLYWDSISNGATHEQLQELYVDICKLAVLSGMEIDKAKRSYLEKIKYYCLVMSEEYIRNHFSDIKKYANVIENRLDDEWCTMESILSENAQMLEFAKKYNVNYLLIEDKYEINIDL